MILCKAVWTNGTSKSVLLPSPERQKEFRTEIKKKLYLHGCRGRQADLKTFYAHGFSCILDPNGNVIFGDENRLKNSLSVAAVREERKREAKTLQKQISRRKLRRRSTGYRPIAVVERMARARAESARQSKVALRIAA